MVCLVSTTKVHETGTKNLAQQLRFVFRILQHNPGMFLRYATLQSELPFTSARPITAAFLPLDHGGPRAPLQ